ncbi:MAG: Sec-independent protein translocase protein TatB [Hyphomicrobium sp.]
MFDISWSELLILGVVALIFVGPKELPVFLRTLGRYAGMARRQAAEFRSHFDEAMREAEMAELREEMDGVRRDILKSAQDAERSLAATTDKANAALRSSGSVPSVPLADLPTAAENDSSEAAPAPPIREG